MGPIIYCSARFQTVDEPGIVHAKIGLTSTCFCPFNEK